MKDTLTIGMLKLAVCKIIEKLSFFSAIDFIIFLYQLIYTESIWEAPKEGYMTIEEYNRLNIVYNARAEQQMYEESKNLSENADEVVAKYRREQLRFIRSDGIAEEMKEKEIERESYTEYEEPPEPTEAQPYGKWQTIVKKYAIFFLFICFNEKLF